MWHYDEDDHLIKNEYFPQHALMEGYNNNVVLYYSKNLSRQKFKYEHNDKHIRNYETQNVIAVEKGKIGHVGNLITVKEGLEYENVFDLVDTGVLTKP